MHIKEFSLGFNILKGILQLIILIGLIFSVYYEQWLNAAIVVGIVIASSAPTLFARRFDLALPPEFDLATIAFLFASIFLGELAGFYERFWWWDLALHTTSGLLLGMLGLSLIWILNHNEKIDLSLSPKFMCLFTFTFTVTAATMWEIFEFGMDRTFGLNMQKSGLDDTMADLMVAAFGALIIATGAYAYFAKGTPSLGVRIVRRFIKFNHKYFKKA